MNNNIKRNTLYIENSFSFLILKIIVLLAVLYGRLHLLSMSKHFKMITIIASIEIDVGEL